MSELWKFINELDCGDLDECVIEDISESLCYYLLDLVIHY